ncbi:Zinc finger, RING/FYVE/PHD-type [Corchorus olitorius]|uniref:Zinc finger, RING/FYVE/PHD-type n=1 Tax=Corchorus olitorius TaxID=93759 RepID=A0A1R3J8T3_9ROSI|nr:Zinc finger, RING/FYVE/PHD-type [Corchorus olitorius]
MPPAPAMPPTVSVDAQHDFVTISIVMAQQQASIPVRLPVHPLQPPPASMQGPRGLAAQPQRASNPVPRLQQPPASNSFPNPWQPPPMQHLQPPPASKLIPPLPMQPPWQSPESNLIPDLWLQWEPPTFNSIPMPPLPNRAMQDPRGLAAQPQRASNPVPNVFRNPIPAAAAAAECPICLLELKEDIFILPKCKHVYHQKNLE